MWQPSRWDAWAILTAPPNFSSLFSVTFLPSSIHGRHYLYTPGKKKWELVQQLMLLALVQPPLMPCPSEELFDIRTPLMFCKHTFPGGKGFLLLLATTDFQPSSPWELQAHRAWGPCREDPAHYPSGCNLLPQLFHLEHLDPLGHPKSSAPQLTQELPWLSATRFWSSPWAVAGDATAHHHQWCSKPGCPNRSVAAFLRLTHPAAAACTPKPLLWLPTSAPWQSENWNLFSFQENKQKFFWWPGSPLWVSLRYSFRVMVKRGARPKLL